MAMGGRHLGTIWASVALDTAPLGAGAARARRMMYALDATMTQKAKSIFLGMAKTALVMGGIIGGVAIKMASDVDSAIRKAGSVAEATEAQMKSWTDATLKLSGKFPQTAKEIGEGLYWIKSDMPDATDADQWKTLEIAMQGAVGGVAELGDATEALIVVQNAYNKSGVELKGPMDYMDAMNVAVQRGSLTLQDFVSNMGKAVGAAAMAKVPFTEIAAAAATLTRKGVPVETAFMALNQTMMAFLKPSKQAKETAAGVGIELSLAALRSKGLAGALMEIAEKVPDEQLSGLFENIRALKAVLPLAGVSVDDFAADLAAMGERSGTTDKMFKINMRSIENRVKVMMNKIRTVLIKLGTDLFPVVEKAVNAIGRVFEGKNKTVNSLANAFKILGRAAYDLAKAVVTLKAVWIPLVAVFATLKIPAIFAGVTSLIRGFSGLSMAIKLMAAGAWGMTGPFASMTSHMGSLGVALSGVASWLGVVASYAAGPIAALAAAGVVLGIAWSHEAELRRKDTAAIKQMNEQNKKQADSASSLIARQEDLNAKINSGTLSVEALAEAKADLKQVNLELVGVFPELVTGYNDETGAVFASTEALKSRLALLRESAGVSADVKVTGVVADFGSTIEELRNMTLQQDSLDVAISQYTDLLREANKQSGKMVFSEKEIFNATEAMTEGWDVAGESLRMLMHRHNQEVQGLTSSTDASKSYQSEQDKLRANLEKLIQGGGSFTAASVAVAKLKGQLSMMSKDMMASALAAGVAGKALDQNFITALTSAEPQMVQLGMGAIQQYIAGMAQKAGVSGPEITALISQMTIALQAGNLGEAFRLAGVIGIDTLTDSLIVQFATMLLPQISVLGNKIPEGLAWAIQNGTPAVKAAVGAMLGSVIVDQVRAVIPQLSLGFAPIPQTIIDGLTNAFPEVKAATAQALTDYITSFAQLNNIPGEKIPAFVDAIKAKLAAGDFTTVGDVPGQVAADSFLLKMGEGLGKGKVELGPLTDSIQSSINAGMEGVNFTDTLSAAGAKGGAAGGEAAVKELQARLDEWDAKKEAKITGDISSAKTTWDNWTPTPKEAIINARIKNPPNLYTADEYARHLEKVISSARPTLIVGAGTAGMDTALDAFANAVVAAQGAMGGDTADSWMWRMLNEDVLQLNQSIMYLTGNNQAALDTWNQVNAAYTVAKTEVDNYKKSIESLNDQIKQSQTAVEKLNEIQTILNANLTASQERASAATTALSNLGQIRIKGEGAYDKKSLALQDKINAAKLKMLLAEKANNYEAAAAYQLQIDKWTKEKEIVDLGKQVKYDKQKRSIESALDPLSKQSLTYSQIMAKIKVNQKIVSDEAKVQGKINARLKVINDRIKVQNDLQKSLQVTLDATQVKYDAANERLNEIQTKMQNIEGAITRAASAAVTFADELARAAAAGEPAPTWNPMGFQKGGYVPATGLALLHAGEYVLPKSRVDSMKMRPLSLSTSHSTSVNVPVYLDSRMIGRAVAKVTGKTASAYAKSGGRY